MGCGSSAEARGGERVAPDAGFKKNLGHWNMPSTTNVAGEAGSGWARTAPQQQYRNDVTPPRKFVQPAMADRVAMETPMTAVPNMRPKVRDSPTAVDETASSFEDSGDESESDWDRYSNSSMQTDSVMDAGPDALAATSSHDHPATTPRSIMNLDACSDDGQPRSSLDSGTLQFSNTTGTESSGQRRRERSFFGVTDKKEPANLRETRSLKLAKLRGCTFVNQYVVIKYLGRGACGRVFLCMDMNDNRLYAVKMVKKVELEKARGGQAGGNGRRGRRNPIDDLRREVAIMRTLRHRNIVALQEVVDDPAGSKMLLVMDYMEGGPVMTREQLERGRRIPEPLALHYFRDMLKALDYLHYNKVVHGDLKPENILMSARGNVALGDFGCSKVIISGNEYLERCNGTPAFLAPEMMRPHTRFRGRPTDVYALGACLYTFVYGRIPFNAPNVFKLFQMVQSEPVYFPPEVPISDDLKDLLFKMLVKDPKQRITVARMMKHPWVTQHGSWPLKSVREMLREGRELNDASDDDMALPDLMATCNVLDVPRQDHLVQLLQPGLQEAVFQDGEYLMRQGEQGVYLMYIIEGNAEVLLRLKPPQEARSREDAVHAGAHGIVGDDLPQALLDGASKAHEFTQVLSRGEHEYLVALRGEGQFVGEMSLFSPQQVRCASVRAKGRVRVKVIPADEHRSIVNRLPEARQQVQEMVWMKLSENMVLEAMTRLSTVYDALEDLLRSGFSALTTTESSV